ncbi:unnamed protein product [Acanthoscelides obtectus]|uniref:Reverse transcriptase n=1 Tax=Acanthoscelides obtectus TaxID=200917 RepID=A0A9P0VQ14_ACAOB|nr:unnamed protein product [Acanthoscelides obtectus]CAK1685879.1 hypothetical protein AOBTE_LOCUS35689 [Acanthoscelides obtectus]
MLQISKPQNRISTDVEVKRNNDYSHRHISRRSCHERFVGEFEGLEPSKGNASIKLNHLLYMDDLKNLQQSDKCRYGCQDSETIQHVIGGCQAFAPTDYKERHDIAAKIIHQELAYKFKLIECKLQYYKYTPQCVLENDKYKLYWDRTVLTDQYINKTDLT